MPYVQHGMVWRMDEAWQVEKGTVGNQDAILKTGYSGQEKQSCIQVVRTTRTYAHVMHPLPSEYIETLMELYERLTPVFS